MGMVVKEMTNSDLFIIRDLLVEKIISMKKIEIKNEVMHEKSIQLSIIPNFLYVNITFNDITVFYADEHDEFWKEPYNTEDEWIKAASEYIITIATSTITADYFYDKITMKLLYYKIFIKNKKYQKKLLKRVFITTNPFVIFKSKTVVSKVLNLGIN